MPTSFNNNYTELSAINGGNQLQNGDSILAEHVNGALQNTAHFKELTDNKVVRRAYIQNNKLYLELATKNNTSNVSVVAFEVTNETLNAVAKNVSLLSGWTSTISNSGTTISFQITGSVNGYSFTIGRDILTYTHTEYDGEGTVIETTTYNLKRVPCFVKISNNSTANLREAFVNLYATKQISSISDLLENIPSGTQISATGHIPGASQPIHSISVTSTQITFYYSNTSSTYSLSDFTITSTLKY